MILKPLKFILKSVIKITVTLIIVGSVYLITTGNASKLVQSLQKYSLKDTVSSLKDILLNTGIIKIVPSTDINSLQNQQTQNKELQTSTTIPTSPTPSPKFYTLYFPSQNSPIYLSRITTNQEDSFNLFTLPDYTPIKLHLNITEPITLHCKVLTSKSAVALGYMYKPKIDKYECLVFAFKEPSTTPFYMKNVNFPLDIIFFDKNLNVITTINNAPPCKQKECPLYFSPKPYRIVIEMKGGNWKEFTQE